MRRSLSRAHGSGHLRHAPAALPPAVIRTQKRIKRLAPGDTLEVTRTDPGALHDIPAWCRLNGHRIVATAEDRPFHELIITIVVGGGADA